MHKSGHPGYDDDSQYPDDLDEGRDPWCKAFEQHKAAHEFCTDHQAMWCRLCDRICPDCVDDPHCPECHYHLFNEYHEWDCSYADD